MDTFSNRFRLSLSYPNPSLGQMASRREADEQSDDQPLTKNEQGLFVEKHAVTGATQTALVVLYVESR
jgi:hypothetical protein